MLRGGGQKRHTTEARLAERMFNAGSRKPAGALNRAWLVLVVWLSAYLLTAVFSPGPARAEAPVCQVPDLQLYEFGQGATMHFVGGFVLRNIGAQPCLIPPITHVEPLDSGGSIVPLVQIYTDPDHAKSVLLPPGQEAVMHFSFPTTRELCPSQSFRPVSALRLTSVDAIGQYIFQFGIDHRWLICDAPNAGVGLAPFGEAGPPQPNEVITQLPLTGTGGSAERSGLPAGASFALGSLLALAGVALVWRSREPDAASG